MYRCSRFWQNAALNEAAVAALCAEWDASQSLDAGRTTGGALAANLLSIGSVSTTRASF